MSEIHQRNNSGSSSQSSSSSVVVPGRPQRRRRRRRGPPTTNHLLSNTIWGAVLLWYSLGVVSIATSKLLLSEQSSIIPIHPITLTLQQLVIGSVLLRLMLHFQGKAVFEIPANIGSDLFYTGACFSVGFLATNFAFFRAAASFVETIKAGEPLTSGILAVSYGLETIRFSQAMYLLTIIVGVLVSTFAQSHSDSNVTLRQAVSSCSIVMISNLCFSFRGLYQKLLRRKLTSGTLDDLNLQFQMQYTGVCILILPVLILEGILPVIRGDLSVWDVGLRHPEVVFRYASVALVNGIAFTSYNLASTYILSRISVVHHAALNCIRRVFAIVITSILFQIPMNLMGAIGIALAVTGFMAYTHSKATTTMKPASELPQ